MPQTMPGVDAALLAAAASLPGHFAGGDELTIEALSAIQATTMSLPGGAVAVECKLKGSPVGAVVLIITGLVDHTTGEVLNRDDARTLWTAALSEVVESLKVPELGEFTPGQMHMTDAFDALDAADEDELVGVFSGQTLAAMVLATPAKKTGKGAAAELAADIAEAAAAAEAAERGLDPSAEASPADTDASAPDAPAGDGARGPAGRGPAAPAQPSRVGNPNRENPALPNTQTPATAAAGTAYSSVTLAPLSEGFAASVDPRRIELLRDVIMGVSVELGRTRLTVQEILGLTPGSIVELDRAAGAPVDVLVNGKLIAFGEVVVVDEEFAVRISEVVNAGDGRISA